MSPQNYISLDKDVYSINLNNVKVSGCENGDFASKPAAGRNLTVRVDRNSGVLANIPNIVVNPGKAMNHDYEGGGACAKSDTPWGKAWLPCGARRVVQAEMDGY